jgi:FMN phosphatase YigB (HAD superfamily)
MLRAILFDLGGTVLSERSYDIGAGYDSISKHIETNQSITTLQNDITLGQVGSSEFSVLEWIRARLSNGVADSRAELLEMDLRDSTVSLEPIDGVEEALKFLHNNSIRVAALSNATFSSTCISRELEKHNLAKYFEFVVSSADIGIRKPHSAPFELALSLFQLTSREVCYVGDSWNADIVGANSASILPIHFAEHFYEPSTQIKHYQLNGWDKFPDLWRTLSNTY